MRRRGRGAVMGVAALACSLAMPLQAETVTVSMKDRVFTPQRIVVKVGDTVQWVNDDTELHQVISGRTPYDRDLGSPMNSGVLMWGAMYAFTFTKSGSYRYLCVIHSALEDHAGAQGMVGEIVVTEQGAVSGGDH